MTTAHRGDADDRQPVRVGFVSLGCAKNLVDTEVMLGHLDLAGCAFVEDPQMADVIVVNTCGFIGPAREESIQAILEAAQLKKTGRLTRLVVAGCMVQRYRDELRRDLPEVDAWVDLDELDRIVERAGLPLTGRTGGAPRSDLPLLETRGRPAAEPEVVDDEGVPDSPSWSASTYLYDETSPRRLATPGWTAYVKIAEGCDHTCAFCAIPSFRGRFRSRPIDGIVREATDLARRGVQEINLIAQDSSGYGRDLGLRDGPTELLERLDAVAGLRWIRVHYLYPNTITDRLIHAMARLPRVVPYVDIPLQHSHEPTLRRMRRGGSARSNMRLVRRFRDGIPGVAIRSTMIVGFPGETEEAFDDLLAFVERARFDHLGVFVYSHEESTAAHAFDDDVPGEVKQDRRDRLMELQQRIAFDRNAAHVGRTVDVLVEGPHAETEHLLVGRMATQAPDVDGQVLINDGIAEPGRLVRVELTETAGYDLVGRVVGNA